jgi:hypothetical protein
MLFQMNARVAVAILVGTGFFVIDAVDGSPTGT